MWTLSAAVLSTGRALQEAWGSSTPRNTATACADGSRRGQMESGALVEIGQAIVVHGETPPSSVDTVGRPVVLLPQLHGGWGDGLHPTTRLICAWMQENRSLLHKARVLDYGCGSGILGLLALRLGASEVVGCDLKPDAVRVAMANASTNQLDSRARFYLPSQAALRVELTFEHSFGRPEDTGIPYLPETETAFDIVLCNIVAGPLSLLARTLATRAKVGAPIALAGLQTFQLDTVLKAYRCAGFEVSEIARDNKEKYCAGSWSLLAGTFHGGESAAAAKVLSYFDEVAAEMDELTFEVGDVAARVSSLRVRVAALSEKLNLQP